MPLATLHLIALVPTTSVAQYVQTLRSTPVQPLVISRVVRWIIRPEKLSATRLLSTTWDLLLILPADQPLPPSLLTISLVAQHWTLTAGIPKSLVTNFSTRNDRLLHPSTPEDFPPLTGSLTNPLLAPSTQTLELTPELLHWSQASPLARQTPLSMLNLLSFHPTSTHPEAHAKYQRYGRAFAENIGKRRGGRAKLVGRVVVDPETAERDVDRYGWDEIALAQYPSATHFVDMLASADYQAVNHESRLPALRDTCILCTDELDPEILVGLGNRGEEGGKAKL